MTIKEMTRARGTRGLAGLGLAMAVVLAAAGCLEARDPAADDGTDAGDGAANASQVDLGSEPPDVGPADAGVELLELGKACVASSECGSGHCAMPCEGYGACAPAACKADGDCAVPGADRTHCCVAGVCKAIQGKVCGDRKGQQGALCGESGQSACADGLACLSPCVSHAYCAAACSDNAACASVGGDLACFKTPEAGKRCVDDPDKAITCALDTDCTGGVCSPYPSFNGTEVIKVCKAAVGKGVKGSKCVANADCAAGFCLKGYCTQACTEDTQCKCSTAACDLDQICVGVTFTLSATVSDATQLCYPATRCKGQTDCSSTKTCVAWPGDAGWDLICVKGDSMAKIPGYACETHADCKTGACHEKLCREICTGDEHCTKGKCQPVALEGKVPTGSKIGLCL